MNTWKDFHVGYYVQTKDGYRGIVIGIFRSEYDYIAVKFPPSKKPGMAFHDCDVLGDERFVEGGPDLERKGCSSWYYPEDLTIVKNIGLGDRVYSEELHKSGTVKCVYHLDTNYDNQVYGVEFDSPVEGNNDNFKYFINYAVGNEEGQKRYCYWCFNDKIVKLNASNQTHIQTDSIHTQTDSNTDSESWQDRFMQEYDEIDKRIVNLVAMLNKWNHKELDFTPKTPYDIFVMQLEAMKEYRKMLRIRAEIEGIVL